MSTLCCPKGHPIEIFWSKCKEEYARHIVLPKTLSGLRIIWRNSSSNVAKSNGQAIMGSLRKKLREIGTGGAFPPLSLRN